MVPRANWKGYRCIGHRSRLWADRHFGGRRAWFVCSVRADGRYCGRRVRLILLALCRATSVAPALN
jgi:hypothetical protein